MQRVELLDTWVDAMDTSELFSSIAEAIDDGRSLLIANHNVHSLAIARRDADFGRFVKRADLVFIDGTPVVFLARLLGHRVTYAQRQAVLEWIWPLLELAERRRWRLVHVGSHPPVIDQALRAIRDRVPQVDIVALPGYFDDTPGSQESQEVVAQIRAAEPDILLVGMGMPRQERWVDAHLDELPACVTITVGGILGFLGGERPTAPRWMGKYGIEWVFRLVTEPSRLWHRYLVEPLVLVRPVVASIWRHRRGRRFLNR